MLSVYSIKFKLLALFLINICCSQEFKGFDDTILYKINWPGKDVTDRLVKEQEENILNVKTAIGESYQCILPKQDEVNKESEPSYNGPNPLELLSPLFSKQACSYRVDTYWIYEICHGRHVRQYHNEREGKIQKEQEYFLGKWKIFDGLKLEEELKRLINLNYPGPTKTRKVDGVNLPYFEMNMSDGTVCDLNGRPRQTNVLYVCYPPSKHNVFSVKETSTCQYEVIVLTSYLCSHPWYKPPNSDELNIDCLPVDDSPRKPHNLKVLQSDTSKLKKQIKMLTNGETKIHVKIQPTSETESNLPKDESSLMMHSKTPNNEIEEYINGDICLYGGSGWWKYEICYNKYIQQVHKEKGKPDEVVVLGVFNLQEHIKWLSQNEEKKPKSDTNGVRQVVSHFYSSGSICQKTGEKRETEVRYKCVKGRYNEDSVALYLLEPKTCKYVLTIESPSLCEIINGPLDEYGIFNLKLRHGNKNEKIKITSEKEEEDKLKQHIEEHVLRKEVFHPLEQEAEESDKKKKLSKIEL
ncbi:endoplasmic reticulum lectin 1 isoform X2 [Sipha flava]|uniref:Endoplasmic reticulum lectin 1 n=1 Tax=Sipha flava TaxID=143950 RepID=A0A8B8FTY9_9HEMI|nr:endoplasmic reticulum lectin 1 isoform X2 [Sipha flava]